MCVTLPKFLEAFSIMTDLWPSKSAIFFSPCAVLRWGFHLSDKVGPLKQWQSEWGKESEG